MIPPQSTVDDILGNPRQEVIDIITSVAEAHGYKTKPGDVTELIITKPFEYETKKFGTLKFGTSRKLSILIYGSSSTNIVFFVDMGLGKSKPSYLISQITEALTAHNPLIVTTTREY